ncbi:uncharacterized protein CDAR_488911 [Caerostris darwini]|uniref:Uncharacterized protein n=1 Tax=Caerostris darwini TaxID=1538125 RepID=A0AAV4VIT7_9ARAC|nr:uncharacterized protein CDAR_488911 [Caerostris darwini]
MEAMNNAEMYAENYRNTAMPNVNGYLNERNDFSNNFSYPPPNEDCYTKKSRYKKKKLHKNNLNVPAHSSYYQHSCTPHVIPKQNGDYSLVENNNELQPCYAEYCDDTNPPFEQFENENGKFTEDTTIPSNGARKTQLSRSDPNFCFSMSAPALLFTFEDKTNSVPGIKERALTYFKINKPSIKNQKQQHQNTKVTGHVLPSGIDQRQDMNSYPQNKIDFRKDREDHEIPDVDCEPQMNHPQIAKMQLKEKSRDNNSSKTEDIRNRTPYRKEDDEIDPYSSYSESDLRLKNYPKHDYRNDFLTKRNMPLQYHNQELKKGPTHYNNRNNAPYSPKFVKHEALPGYELPYHPYYKSTNDRSSRKSESCFSAESFLQKELSAYKQFLIQRHKAMKNKPARSTALKHSYIPLRSKIAEHQEKIKKDEIKHLNDQKSEWQYSSRKPNFSHPIRKPKISEDELWKIYETFFRNYTKTRRRAGEVIPRKTSTEWMCNMGIVGDLLTEKDANDSFKRAAG